MSADTLLSRLDGVHETDQGRWRARCPSHGSKGRSLSIRDGDDGRVLIHCFAGCETEEVLGAVGLTFPDVMPERLAYNHGSMRRPFPAADVLETIAREVAIVATAACNIRAGVRLSDEDHERLLLASDRIHEARRLANGER